MSATIPEAKEVLQGFGVILPEDQPWVVEPDFSERDQFLFHLLKHGRGICMDHRGGPVTLFFSVVERRLSDYGVQADLSDLQEKHAETYELYIWLADATVFLKEQGMVFLYLGGLDDTIVFDFLPVSEAVKLQESGFFREILDQTESFLDPDKWTTWIIEDA